MQMKFKFIKVEFKLSANKKILLESRLWEDLYK